MTSKGDKSQAALLIVDVQQDFLPGGKLAVPRGDRILPVIQSLLSSGSYSLIVATQDSHPPLHISFASTHSDLLCQCPPRPLQPPSLRLHYSVNSAQLLAIDYGCDEGDSTGNGRAWSPAEAPAGLQECADKNWLNQKWTRRTGWELSKGLGIHIEGDYSKEKAEAATLLPAATTHSPQTEMFVLRKGQLPNLDAYSAFFNNGCLGETGLNDLLLDRGISCVHIVGLALDVCVLWTALDAVNLGFDVTVFPNATVAMDSNAERIAQDALVKAGIKLCDWTCD